MTELSAEDKRLLQNLDKVDSYLSKCVFFQDELNKLIEEVNSDYWDANKVLDVIEIKQKENSKLNENIGKLLSEKTSGFLWLADAIAQYYEAKDLFIAEYLENKKHPAIKQAEDFKAIAKEKRIFKREYAIARNIIKYYETLFPWLQDYLDENLDELICQIGNKEKDEQEEPVLRWLLKAEYEKIPASIRNQKALDRYMTSTKSSWVIGRDFERYIGYKYEMNGWHVKYQGIEEGLEDLGRDLICTKGNIVEIIQCKYWSRLKNKKIHEKHINQLFGTTVKYVIDNKCTIAQEELFSADILKKSKIVAKIITSVELTETAKAFAQALGIQYEENVGIAKYPVIKCNINPSTKEKIYHLPFDQQYDTTVIDSSKGECYTETVAEAENKGFRRAWRWQGDKA